MRIKSIEAENFKLFTSGFNKIQNINYADLVLFNGPNGYGKTSVFDIIELCFTGEIKRINTYSNSLKISKNEAFDSKILISDNAKPAFVKVCFEHNNEEYEVGYYYTPLKKKGKTSKASKENNPHKIFDNFEQKIYRNKVEILDADPVKEMLLADDIKEVFDKCCFLSQDEHLQFLKEAKEDKVKSLSFLFDVPEKWEKEKMRVESYIDALSNQRKQCYLKRIESKENELNDIIENLQKNEVGTEAKSSGENELSFNQLFVGKKIIWDSEHFILGSEEYNGAIQELDALIFFCEHREECRNYLFNKPLKKLLKPYTGGFISVQQFPLEYSYRYSWMLDKANEIETRYNKEKEYKEIKQYISEQKYEQVKWEFLKTEGLLEEIDIQDIQQKLDNVKTIKDTMGVMETTLHSLQSSRKSLINYTDQMIKLKHIPDAVCPLCGTQFRDYEELKRQFENEAAKLVQLCDNSGTKVNTILTSIYEKYLQKMEIVINDRLDNTVSLDTYQKMLEVRKHSSAINEVAATLNKIGISLPKETLIDSPEDYNGMLNDIKRSLKIIDEKVNDEIETKDFSTAFDRYFDNDEEKYFSLSIPALKNKKNYVKEEYYSQNRKTLKDKRAELDIVKKRKEKLKKIINELEIYRNAIDEGIQEYKKRIVADIEPLLYIYTAKILQQKFNGKSIFVHTDDNIKDIQLVNSLNDKQDILYSMSSGQLSAVALAFLLCMNQVYNNEEMCSLLLIDDPVQTIDDVNMVGFVDLLRYEFPDRQIFVSTHEQKFEWFLRYRLAKAEKSVEIVNMKNLMLVDR